MPYDLFWHGNPILYSHYKEAYEKKQENEDKAFIHRENFKAWIQGFYVDIALSCHPFGSKPHKYISEPIEIDTDKKEKVEETTNEELSKKEEATAMAQFMAFGQFAEAFNKKRKENGN